MLRICSALILVGLFKLPAFAAEVVGRVHVIDGDTFHVAGARIRLHAIDAPEHDQPCKTEQGVDWACGAWISKVVQDQFEGKTAVCQILELDKYERSVATCNVQGRDVGGWLVSQGYAFAYVKYGKDYAVQERRAAAADRGLHALRLQSPAQHRLTRAKGRIPPDRSCAIKGNVSYKGVKIYHVPGQTFYEQTGIREERGERWFCSTAAAEIAGWRAAKR